MEYSQVGRKPGLQRGKIVRELSLRTSLILLMVVASTLTFALVGGTLLLFRLPQVEARARAQLQERAENTSRLLDHFTAGVDAQLAPLGRLARGRSPTELQAYVDAIVGDGEVFEAVFILAANGAVETLGLPGKYRKAAAELHGADFSGNRLFQSARVLAQTGEPAPVIWSDKYLSALSGKITVGVALTAGDKIIIGEASLERILGMLKDAARNEEATVVIVDGNGQWLASSNPDPNPPGRFVDYGSVPAFKAVMSGRPPPDYDAPFGQRLLVSGMLSGKLRWAIAAAAPAGWGNYNYRMTILLVSGGFFGSMLISMLLAPLWAARMQRPLKALIARTNLVTAGDYVAPWPARGRIAELNRLTENLSNMTQVIQIRESEFRNLNSELEERVARRTEELMQSNDELEAMVDNLKETQDYLVQSEKLAALGNIVAGVAHELNTPIGNGLLAISTLRDRLLEFRKELTTGLRRSALDEFVAVVDTGSDIAVRNMRRAAELVTSFKQVAVDQTSSQRRTFSIQEVVDEILMTLNPMLKRTPYTVETEIPEALTLDSYPGPLGQVLANLINNAVLHGFGERSRGKIRIVVSLKSPGYIQMSVHDDGKGIPAELLGHIFDPFYTTRRGRGGTGLGLHVTHSLVSNVLGGTVSVNSRVGEGTEFVIVIPQSAPLTATPSRPG